ncbi:polysaccharide deacetylase family protein [Bacteroides pyogenes]|uniref:polysaccharide deacetylase family protein n=1 Tax=Bacteroides pyogenes TaxID=310300 RepID=UPI000E19381D|nr:polysaccharide deacetylase family protein [Bacteroides pyogenes]MBB3894533.1 peptidoglycan/xylan/chitin deacetylase (PgdA/CDA1 family) [Bacteroides pyogenes]SUV32461.1 xylanase/chitin deacetylase [Bacteroides pyogenes]
MTKNYRFFLSGALCLLLVAGCGSKQSSKSVSEADTVLDSVEVTQLSELTEEITLNDSDEDIQVFTMRIGNDPDKSHLTVSFPITKYRFVNEYEQNFSQKFIDEFKNEVKKYGDNATSALDFNQHFEIKYRSDELLIFLYARSTSHGNNYEDTFHASMFDLKNKKRVSPADLFENNEAFADFASEMRGMAEKAVREKLDQSDAFANEEERETVWQNMLADIEEGTQPTEENYDALFFDENKQWYVIFDKYQIANGSMGSFTIKIPRPVIDKYLKKTFASLFVESKKVEEEIVVATPPRPQPTPSAEDLQAPCVALTFDDGPSVYTARLLDILKAENVKATFFVLGKSAAVQKQTMRRMAEEGHNIGNHSYDHKNFAKISVEEAQRQITLTDDIAQEITGGKPGYFRFPYGAYTNDKLALVNRPVIAWNIDPLDWKYRDAERVASEMSKASPNAIILGHDIHKTTVEAIPAVIRNLKAKGYRIVTLDELFANKQIKNNHIYNSGK